MRIAMITPEFPPHSGGIGSYVAYLSRRLTELGHQIVVLVRSTEDSVCLESGFEVRRIAVGGIAPFNTRWFRKKLEKHLEIVQPDLLHIHSSSMPVVRVGVPVVATSHWCVAEGTRFFYPSLSDFESLYRSLMLGLYVRIERHFARDCDLLTVVGHQMQEDYLNRYGVSSAVVSNGVDPDVFVPSSGSFREPTVVYAGQLKRGKGLLDLADAAALLKTKLPEISYHIFGNGPLMKTLKKRISSHGLKNVLLHGSVDHSRLREALSTATVAVLPSYYEGLPTFLLEAMACETPVIASRARGNNELVRDGVNGILFTAGDSKGLADAVERMFRLDNYGRQMGRRGREYVLQDYTWVRVAKTVLEVYAKVLRSPAKIP